MDHPELFAGGPFSLTGTEKENLYRGLLSRLTDHHRRLCGAYANYLQAIGCPEGGQFSSLAEVPFLPVSVFKERELCSVAPDEVYKTITSSGTSGQKVSRIFLDARTSELQQLALSSIVGDFVGGGRLPYLVLDTKKVLKDRAMFSARGAGILGFSLFASGLCFALDEEMKPDFAAIEAFLEKNRGKPVLVFGFTFILWKQFICELERLGKTLPLEGALLVHGGGWKKLAAEAVGETEFKRRVQAVTGITRISNYYGMAEQTGCIYMECGHGHLHVSRYSEILVRRARDYSLCEQGEEGILEVLSPIPLSYPGHALLTEDLGVVLGEDDCPCGRKGKYFAVRGRIPKAEVRGCSDTYEG